MKIDLLCRVIDNYGDIGVVYRLAKALSALEPTLELRLIVDGLSSFSALVPEIEPCREEQRCRGWEIYPWELPKGQARQRFRAYRPRLIVEAFACGKPAWYEELVFDPADPEPRTILNLEYLTAEDYAAEFHLFRAATRSPLVRKFFFMPGFTEGTAGLILDRDFAATRERLSDPAGRQAARLAAARRAGLAFSAADAARLWVLVFSYERDFRRIVADLAAYGQQRPLLALVAAGRSSSPFFAAWEEAGRPFPAHQIPFLRQEAWDELLLAADVSIVRGEESLARAALGGRPFLWHAYLQDEAHQLVKVQALLDCMRPHFAPEDHAVLSSLFLAFNDRRVDSPASGGGEALLPFLERLPSLETGFASFARKLDSLGDLALHLLTFFREIG